MTLTGGDTGAGETPHQPRSAIRGSIRRSITDRPFGIPFHHWHLTIDPPPVDLLIFLPPTSQPIFGSRISKPDRSNLARSGIACHHGRRRSRLPPCPCALAALRRDYRYVSSLYYEKYISKAQGLRAGQPDDDAQHPPSPPSPRFPVKLTHIIHAQSAETSSSEHCSTSPASTRGTCTAPTARSPRSTPTMP